MAAEIKSNDLAIRYLAGLGARVAAESGRAADRQHLGKLLLRSLRDDPAFLHQIDGATDERETAGSVLARSVLCARALRRLGAGVGDVAAILAPNHIHVVVPYYACLYLGVAVCGVDHTLTWEELQSQFAQLKPRAVFCQREAAGRARRALDAAGLTAEVVLFEALEEFMRGVEEDVDSFRASDFDPAQTLAFLTPTSGTTGLPKVTECTHRNMVVGLPNVLYLFSQFPRPTRLALLVSPLQWMTATWIILAGALFQVPRLQTSRPCDAAHAHQLINRYRPTWTMCSPAFVAMLMGEGRDQCDFTCFEFISIGGNAVTEKLIQTVKEATPNTLVFAGYGMSEANSIVFANDDPSKPWAVGRPVPTIQHKLVNLDTQEVIHEPNVPGELWIKGESMFKGYYNAPAATAEAFTADGWLRTGDVFRRDDAGLHFFVERIKLLMKYMNHQVSPTELEQVISALRGVAAAAVSSVGDAAAGDLPVAFVVRRAQHRLTAQEVKDHVRERLADTKQLRGGVVFVEQIPTTSTGKVHRRRLKELAQTMARE